MPVSLDVTKAAIDDFKKIQKYMILAKEENEKYFLGSRPAKPL